MSEPVLEKKTWYWVHVTSSEKNGFCVKSKTFHSYDEKYLYERSGKRTPRKSSWRTWYDSEVSAIGCYSSMVGRWIESDEKSLKDHKSLRASLSKELDRLIDEGVMWP